MQTALIAIIANKQIPSVLDGAGVTSSYLTQNQATIEFLASGEVIAICDRTRRLISWLVIKLAAIFVVVEQNIDDLAEQPGEHQDVVVG